MVVKSVKINALLPNTDILMIICVNSKSSLVNITESITNNLWNYSFVKVYDFILISIKQWFDKYVIYVIVIIVFKYKYVPLDKWHLSCLKKSKFA